MRRLNIAVIATIIAAFAVSMFIFQPTATEASPSAMPSATPRKILKPVIKNPTKVIRDGKLTEAEYRLRKKPYRHKRHYHKRKHKLNN